MSDSNQRDQWWASGEVTRRLLGLTVVAVAFLIFIVVAAIRGRVTTGQAIAPPIKDPPAVGDCMTGNPDEWTNPFAEWSSILPAREIQACTGSRYAEVVLVIDDFSESMAATDISKDPYYRCDRASHEYLGVPNSPDLGWQLGAQPPATEPVFTYAATVLFAYLGPDSRQRAIGQAWAACVVWVPASVEESTLTPTAIDHSLQGSWLRAEDQQLFSTCLDDASTMDAVNCRRPHRYEMIGFARGTPAASQEAVDNACRAIVLEALGSPAAIDGGSLTTQVVSLWPNPNQDGTLISSPDAAAAEGPYFSNCLLTPTDPARRLTAPLLGLGDQPVPMN